MANQKRREQILLAALDLFDQRGFHGTGMEDIAKAVGMRASSLYNHYHSKQELLTEISVGAMEDLLRTNAAALAGPATPQDKLVAAMRNHVVFHATRARQVRVTNKELGNLEEPHRSVVLQLRRDYVARWMKFVNEGMADGSLAAPDVKIACWALIDMGIGVAQWYADGGKYSAEELGDLYGQFALAQLGAHTARNQQH